MSPSITLLIFMAADNNLDSSAMRDLESIKKASRYSDMDIVIQLDRWEFVDAKEGFRYHIKGGEERIIKRLGEVNSGDVSVLKNFIEESARAYPSDKLMVIIWSHGSGVDDRDIYHPSRDRFFVEEVEIEEIAISFDDEAKDFLDNVELKMALDVDVDIDILGFDACLMGMFEIAYQLKNQADIIIASQYIEPASGWPYEKILEDIKGGDTPRDIGKKIVDFYGDYYARDNSTVTQSAYDIQSIDAVAKNLDDFSAELKAKLSDKKALKHIFSRTQDFNRSDYIDLVHFVKLVEEELTITFSQPLLTSLEKMIVANRALGYSMEDAHGVSIYFPRKKNPFKETFESYEKLDFSHDYPNWIELIRWYHL